MSAYCRYFGMCQPVSNKKSNVGRKFRNRVNILQFVHWRAMTSLFFNCQMTRLVCILVTIIKKSEAAASELFVYAMWFMLKKEYYWPITGLTVTLQTTCQLWCTTLPPCFSFCLDVLLPPVQTFNNQLLELIYYLFILCNSFGQC